MSTRGDQSSPHEAGIFSTSTKNKRKAVFSLSVPTKRSHSNSIRVLNLGETQKEEAGLKETKEEYTGSLKPDITSENIKKIVRLFGKNPEFNSLIYSDDNVLNCLTIKQRLMNFQVEWDIKMENKLASCKYTLKTPEGNELTGETFSTNKKLAKKQAAREILSNLSIPTFEEMDENSRWMISVHKNLLNTKDEVVEKTFTDDGCVCKIEWKVGDVTYLGTGEGKDFKEAELYANQDLYIQTHKLKNVMNKHAGKNVANKSLNNHENKLESLSNINKSMLDDELSRSDAAQINNMRNMLISKIKIKQEENVIAIPGGFQCTLAWNWVTPEGIPTRKTVIKSGSSKLLAKANASKTMLVELGTIQDISANESHVSNKIKAYINTDVNESVRLACELINTSNSTVWRLFILQLWNKLLFNTDKSSILKLLTTIVDVQSKDDKQTRRLQGDIWESMLYNLIFVMDEDFVKTVLNIMRGIKLNESHFYSKKALDYYQNNTILLCMEYQCNIYNEAQLKKDNVALFKNEMLVMDVAKLQMPNIMVTSRVEYEYIRTNIFKENDIVLLLPISNGVVPPSEQPNLGVLCNVLKHKVSNFILNMSLKFISFVNIDNTNNQEDMKVNKAEYTVVDEAEVLNKYGKYNVIYLKSLIPYSRMVEATQSLTHIIFPINSNASKYVFTYEMKEILLNSKKYSTNPSPSDWLMTTMTLTPVQYTATISALKNPLTLIQGPPGTGKTHVACAIIDCWAKLNPNIRILAVADSNIAADNLIDALTKKNIQALRIGQSSEYELQEESIKNLDRYQTYLKLKMGGHYKEAKNLKVLLYSEAIKQHNIIIATCVGSGNDLLSNYQFSHVIIDECSQSIEMSNLIPIGKGCKSLVLIGDHKQLRPTIISNYALKLGLDKSLLERLIQEEVAPVHMLNVQRRMHPSIIEFPNMHFYANKIFNQDVNDINRSMIRGFKWPVPFYNLVFIDVSTPSPNTQFEIPQGKSKINMILIIYIIFNYLQNYLIIYNKKIFSEIKCVIALLNSFLKSNDVKEQQIGILTPYDAQKLMIKKHLKPLKEVQSHLIEVDSVDGFQGREKDLIIFSAVRSNMVKDIGFLRDPRRMNVMLTRARRGLVVLGDSHTLMSDRENWRPYLNWIYSKQLNIHISQLNGYLDFPDHSLPNSLADLQNLMQFNTPEYNPHQFNNIGNYTLI
ncbi:regulator of nonsense transcripts-related protein, putative [Theileria annulata]|uniref:Regulator of nonsense transcripts-related protein, putative n=1 Tax=Theileria annulata TaxID=5874 RepID=Q4UBC2_THEAN|nr:regulator of nonsense transcripts-related protein, putative [Theileria annulata]CAI75879.1 regulator of nonsense transcripts-related protein, putative [Theileria annulata]|eukprot:XP_955355.1 regulator of nonsense transcripts-related protein, putative [Theileria annulata]